MFELFLFVTTIRIAVSCGVVAKFVVIMGFVFTVTIIII